MGDFGLKIVIWGWKNVEITIIKPYLSLSEPLFVRNDVILQCSKKLANFWDRLRVYHSYYNVRDF